MIRKEPLTFLDVHQVARRYGVSVPTIWAWARQAKLPQPIRITPGTSRWSVKQLEAFEGEREALSGNSRAEYEENERRRQMPKQRQQRKQEVTG